MRRLLILTAIFLLSISIGRASHIRAGEIIAERISNSSFTYQMTLVIYTKTSSGIAIDSATLNASDGWSQTVHFTDTVGLGNDVTRARYIFTNTFNVGSVMLWFEDQNRVGNILNMDNSLNTAFYIETLLVLDPALGLNTSPILLVPPIDDGSTNQIYNYNPGAFDADGDSLSYEMDIPMLGQATDVVNYVDPGLVAGTNEVELDSALGNLVWDVPLIPGVYNVAYRIYEWRNGNIIGFIHRDMQIVIYDNNNNKPELNIPEDTCVVAGEVLRIGIGASDPDNDALEFEAYGGVIPPATFNDTSFGTNYGGVFTWTPGCSDVREDPYQIIFKASDSPSKDPSLVDIKNWGVKVSGPKIQNITVTESTTPFGLELNWNSYTCSNASKINIYRKGCASGGEFDICAEVTPEERGFVYVETVADNVTSFLDTAVTKGQQYCYVLQAEFPAPEYGKSLVSDESCAIAGSQYPLITMVNVTNTDETSGKIRVEWQDPVDTSLTVDPNDVEIQRSENGTDNFISLGSFPSASIIDSNLNTVEYQYYYRLVYSGLEGDHASSVFLTPQGNSQSIDLAWDADVPWENAGFHHYIYARFGTDTSLPLTLLDSVFVLTEEEQTYSHSGLEPTDTVCYYVMTVGSYCNGTADSLLYNNSQIACAVPRDEQPPCPPTFDITSDCESGAPYTNFLTFTPEVSPPFCINDVVSYDIYYAPYEGDTLLLLTNSTDTTYDHTQSVSLAGCYYVTATDASGNVSAPSDTICIDNCPRYILPNIFTPNGDSLNNLFSPIIPTRFVKSIEFRIFNRWGRKVFETNDPTIQWTGADEDGSPIPDGMYFYVADLEFYRLRREDEAQEIKGWFMISR